MRKLMKHLPLMLLVLMWLICLRSAAEAGILDGSVANVSGQTGRLYLSLKTGDGRETGLGTSMGPVVSDSIPFSLSGVADGTYALTIFLDTSGTGIRHANDPTVTIEGIAVSGGYGNTGSISLGAPGTVLLPSAPLAAPLVVPAKEGVLVVLRDLPMVNGAPVAENIVVSCGEAGFVSAIPGVTGTAAYLRTTPGQTVSCSATPVISGTERPAFTSPPSPPVQAGESCVSANTCGNGATVTGTVNLSGGTASPSTPLVVMLTDDSSSAPLYAAIVTAGQNPAIFSMAGVAPGTYTIHAFLDQNGDKVLYRGDLVEDARKTGSVTVDGTADVSVPEISMSAFASFPDLGVVHMLNGDKDYALRIHIRDGVKLPVAVSLSAGTGGQLPDPIVSVGRTPDGSFVYDTPAFSARPVPGETYQARVTYDDGSDELRTLRVTGVMDDFPTVVVAPGTGPGNTPEAILGWQAPVPLPGYPYTYAASFPSSIWSQSLPLGESSVFKGFPLAAPMTENVPYEWSVGLTDAFGNTAVTAGKYVSTGAGPVILGVAPERAPAGSAVSITGTGLADATSVSFNGAEGFINSASDTTLVATVPEDAPTGPIVVTAAGKKGSSSTPFTPTIVVGGSIMSGAGTAVGGISAMVVGTPASLVTSAANGAYRIPNTAGIPSGVPFVIKAYDPNIAQSGYHDVYSGFISSTRDLFGMDITVFNDADLLVRGFPAVANNAKGIIYGRVADSTGSSLYGASVSASSWKHPETPYSVIYGDENGFPASSLTATSYLGTFYVTDIDDGDVVTVTPSKEGLAFAAKAFPVRAGAVSQGAVRGDFIAAVAVSPPPGVYYAPLQVTLSPNRPATVYYTTNGLDPALYGTIYSESIPVAADTTIRYVVKTSVGVPGGAGTASYLVRTQATSTTVTVPAVSPNPSTFGQPVSIASSVSPAGASGKILFSNNNGWQESVDVSTLGGTASATTASLPVGTHLITAQYLGDETHSPSPVSPGTLLTVNKASATVTLGSLAATYNGTPRQATVTTVPAGLAVTITYNGSTSAPTAAGSFTVVATVSDPYYQGTAAGTLTISPASTTARIVSVSPNPAMYRQPTAITASVSPADALGTVRFSDGQGWQETMDLTALGGSTILTTTNLAVGAHSITAQYLGDANHAPSPVSSAVSVTVNKATATVTLGSLSTIYNGSPRAATAVTVPAGLPVSLTYNGSPTAPTAAGSYTVVATVTDPNYQGSATGTLTIAKASTTASISSILPNPSTYGQSVNLTARVSPAGASGKLQFTNGQGWQESVDVSTIGGTATTSVSLPAGTHTMTAQYLGDSNYAPSPVSAGVAMTVNKASQSITFPAPGTKTYGDAPFQLGATSSSGLTVSYASSNPAVATISGSTVTIVGAGTATITASQAGNGNYAAATPVSQVMTVNKAPATVTLSNLSTTYTGTPRPVTATTVPAGLAVTITYNGSSAPPVPAGTYAVVATVADPNYQGSASGSLTVAKADQMISFQALPTKIYGAAQFALTATASSGLAVGYATGNPAVATINGSTVTIAGTGTAVITATQPGDANYNPASAVTQPLTVDKAVLTVTASDATRVYGTPNPALTAGYSGFVNGESQSILTGAPAITTSATLSSPAGTYQIVPAAGTLSAANYTFAFVNGTLTVQKADQTITFVALATQTYTDPPITLGGTASSGLALTYSSSNTSVATINGNVLTIVGAGTATITAAQAGDGNFNPASPVTRPLTVNKATATVSLGNLSATYDGTPKAATATTVPPGLSVILTYDGSTTPPTKKGNYTVVGTINDPNYQGSATGTLTIARGTQKITFDPLPGKTYGDAPFQLTATSSSGLPVSYTSSNTSVATVNGSTLTIVGAGTSTITASQSGDNNFGAAQSVSQTLTVSKATLTVTANDATRIYGAPNPSFTARYSGFVNGDTQTVLSGNPSITTTATAGSPAGNSTITAGIGTLAAINYAFTFTNGTLKIDKAILTVTPANAQRPYKAPNPTFTASFTGFVNGDTQSVVTGFPAISTTATETSPADTYPLTAAIGTLNAANYTFAFGTGTLTVIKAEQTIAFPALQSRTYGTPPFTLTATASSGLAIGYSSSNPAVATVSGSTVTIVGAGTTTITATQPGDGNYNAATPVSQQLSVSPASQGGIRMTAGGASSYYATIAEAYNAIGGGTNPSISLLAGAITEALLCDKNYAVTLTGGMDETFSAVTGATTLKGKLTITNGTIHLGGSLIIAAN